LPPEEFLSDKPFDPLRPLLGLKSIEITDLRHVPPHWMILWPFEATDTGLPTMLKRTGTWIMYAGTPWAHLMINGRP